MIHRVQFPIMPADVRTIHSAQGRTFKQKSIFDLSKASGMDDDSYWLNLYTALSRPTRLVDMLLYNLPEKEVLEHGAPADLKEMLERYEQEDAAVRARVDQLMAAYGRTIAEFTD